MLRILIIFLLSVTFIFSCTKKNEVKKTKVLVDGKVQEVGCKRFDFYCKRTGEVLDTSDILKSTIYPKFVYLGTPGHLRACPIEVRKFSCFHPLNSDLRRKRPMK